MTDPEQYSIIVDMRVCVFVCVHTVYWVTFFYECPYMEELDQSESIKYIKCTCSSSTSDVEVTMKYTLLFLYNL